jgi:hypothetical protein
MAAPDEVLAFKVNPKVVATSDPPIPLAAAWASLYASSADEPIVNLAQGVLNALAMIETSALTFKSQQYPSLCP